MVERESQVWGVLEGVPDPEIPILSIVDLGIVRYVRWDDAHDAHDAQRSDHTEKNGLHVGLTPTYAGCPATDVIRVSVARALARAGFQHAIIEEVLSPPWTSDWLSCEGRRKLTAFGIAPPAEGVSTPRQMFGSPLVACPRCGSEATTRVSEFGSTPCKAHYRCTTCFEPFDYFKCI
jgi:ring-1,2-phenylacetyl-CoA epoxidase subunit PaaD